MCKHRKEKKEQKQVQKAVIEEPEEEKAKKKHLRKVGAYELDEEVADILQDIKLHSNIMF